MKTSQKGIELIKKWESLHDGDLKKIGIQPKLCPANIWTAGYGHAIIDPGTGKHLTKDTVNGYMKALSLFPDLTELQAEELLQKDLNKFENKVNRNIKVELNQNQFDALVSYFYNIGYSETMVKLINSRSSKDDIYKWFTEHYIKANGIVLKGLINRRKDEAELFFKS